MTTSKKLIVLGSTGAVVVTTIGARRIADRRKLAQQRQEINALFRKAYTRLDEIIKAPDVTLDDIRDAIKNENDFLNLVKQHEPK